MRHQKLMILAISFLIVSTIYAQEFVGSSTPYMTIESTQFPDKLMPVKNINYEVNISGMIAHIVVNQTFVNETYLPMDAKYVFPGSTKAAVYDMKMTIGSREIQAEIFEKAKARRKYQNAINSGFTASLLEQQRVNVFTMEVGNIHPGDTIVTSLYYTEMIKPYKGIYELVIPTVVGPRYQEEQLLASTDDSWIHNPYLVSKTLPNYTFDMDIQLTAGVPIRSLRSISHQMDFTFSSARQCAGSINIADQFGGNRDFILQYSLNGPSVSSGIMTYNEENEQFFTMMIQPPKQLHNLNMPPREYIFLLDVSGSMHGIPLDITKQLTRRLFEVLRPQDKFNIVLFESNFLKLFRKPQSASLQNLKEAQRFVSRMSSGGGTNLTRALQHVLNQKENFKSHSSSIIVISDGYISAEDKAFKMIRNNLNDVNVFAFGIGASVNRHLIEGIAKAGRGEPFVVTTSRFAMEKAQEFFDYIEKPGLTNVTVDFGNNSVYDVYPKVIPDVLAERPLMIYGKYFGTLNDTISISGLHGQGVYNASIPISKIVPTDDPGLKRLWAYNTYREKTDFQGSSSFLDREMTDFALKYSLLSAYTSFVAIDKSQTISQKAKLTIDQPLPLPLNVGDMAAQHQVARLNATGAVSRCVGNSTFVQLNYGFDYNQEFINDEIIISWTPLYQGPYKIEVNNIFDQVVFEQTATENFARIDTRLLNETLLIINVSNEGGEFSTGIYGAKKSEREGIPKLIDFEKRMPLDYYLNMIEIYLEEDLIIDAITAYEMAYYHYPSRALRDSYINLLVDINSFSW
ncbi:MAG: VWA domain-containing protein [Cyclobacteriaceae bacterium]